MKVEAVFTNEQITNLLLAVLEDGDSNWFRMDEEDVTNILKKFDAVNIPSVETICKAVLEGNCSVKIIDFENGKELGTLNLDTIQKGFSAMLKENAGSVQKEAIVCIICDDYDGPEADVWFQMVIMGEIIYG